MEDELKYDEAGPGLSQVSTPVQGTAGAVFFGKGGLKDTKLGHLERYIKDVEHSVARALDTTREVPLVLLGVDYEVSYYRLVNTYQWLTEAEVLGATDELKPHEVHTKALEALRPYFEQDMARQAEELFDYKGSELSSYDPEFIAQAAAEGRVRAMFFDEDSHPSDESGWDLVDLAAVETVLHGGEVHSFGGENAPLHGVAALLRW